MKYDINFNAVILNLTHDETVEEYMLHKPASTFILNKDASVSTSPQSNVY